MTKTPFQKAIQKGKQTKKKENKKKTWWSGFFGWLA